MMKVVCAWCGRDMGEQLGPVGLVSHGMCSECEKKESPSHYEGPNGHVWGPLGRRDRDDATHECDKCGMLVELEADGNPAYPINEECSGIMGVYPR